MASVYNLKRNSRVFFTTNVNTSTGVINTSSHTNTTTYELSVLDGFSFTQTTTAQAITLNEAGATPTRGQRSFNTALNPVDFSFSTYMRPISAGGTADEGVLWNALFGDTATSSGGVAATITGTPTVTYDTASGVITLSSTTFTAANVTAGGIYTISGVTGTNANQFNTAIKVTSFATNSMVATYIAAPTGAAPAGTNWSAITFHSKSWISNNAVAADGTVTVGYSEVTAARSNVNQLLKFGLIIIADNITYTIDDCALDQASIDFGLDGIATIAWTGKGKQLNQLATSATADTASPVTFGGGITGSALAKTSGTTLRYLTNKLSTVELNNQLGGGGGTTTTLAITGGNIQISNNLNYITSNNLGVVNQAVQYFTGTRSITGNLTAYLKTGSTDSAGLLSTILGATSSSTEFKYKMLLNIGGNKTATNRVELLMNGASLQVPTVDASQDVLSTSIQFTIQPTDSVTGTATANYDVGNVNDIRIRYFAG